MAAIQLEVQAELPNGERYQNIAAQFVRLRWGKAVEDFISEDTQRLVEALSILTE